MRVILLVVSVSVGGCLWSARVSWLSSEILKFGYFLLELCWSVWFLPSVCICLYGISVCWFQPLFLFFSKRAFNSDPVFQRLFRPLFLCWKHEDISLVPVPGQVPFPFQASLSGKVWWYLFWGNFSGDPALTLSILYLRCLLRYQGSTSTHQRRNSDSFGMNCSCHLHFWFVFILRTGGRQGVISWLITLIL